MLLLLTLCLGTGTNLILLDISTFITQTFKTPDIDHTVRKREHCKTHHNTNDTQDNTDNTG